MVRGEEVTLKPHCVSLTLPPATKRTSRWNPLIKKFRYQCLVAMASSSKCAREPTTIPTAPSLLPAMISQCSEPRSCTSHNRWSKHSCAV